MSLRTAVKNFRRNFPKEAKEAEVTQELGENLILFCMNISILVHRGRERVLLCKVFIMTKSDQPLFLILY